jgi:cytoskeletal protein RodZ
MSLSGKLLKEVREQRGLSLEQVSSDLKIHIRILQALEEESQDIAVPAAIRRGFLRSYARYLGYSESAGSNPSGSGAAQEAEPGSTSFPTTTGLPQADRKTTFTRVKTEESSYHKVWWWLAGLVGLMLLGRGVYELQAPKAPEAFSFSLMPPHPPTNPVTTNASNPSEGPTSFSSAEASPSAELSLAPFSTELRASDLGAQPFPPIAESSSSNSIPQGSSKRRWVVIESQQVGELLFQTPSGTKVLSLKPEEVYLLNLSLPVEIIPGRESDASLILGRTWQLIDQARALKSPPSGPWRVE